MGVHQLQVAVYLLMPYPILVSYDNTWCYHKIQELDKASGDTQLLGAGVLGDSFGALRHGMLGQLSGQEETDSSLDLPRGDSRPLVVVGQFASLRRNPFEQVIDERVHDGHSLRRDSSVRMHLLQDLVDVDSIAH